MVNIKAKDRTISTFYFGKVLAQTSKPYIWEVEVIYPHTPCKVWFDGLFYTVCDDTLATLLYG